MRQVTPIRMILQVESPDDYISRVRRHVAEQIRQDSIARKKFWMDELKGIIIMLLLFAFAVAVVLAGVGMAGAAEIYHAEGHAVCCGNYNEVYSVLGGSIDGEFTYYAYVYFEQVIAQGGIISAVAYMYPEGTTFYAFPDTPLPYFDESVTLSGEGSGDSRDTGLPNKRARLKIDTTSSVVHHVTWDWYHTLIISDNTYTLSGTIGCVDDIDLYINNSGTWLQLVFNDDVSEDSSYTYNISNGCDYRIAFDGAYYDFTCDGNEVFDYDACIYVYGYTCGVGDIYLYVDDGGWVLEDSVSQSMLLADYEMVIESGKDYKLNMHGISQLVDTYLFSCTGDHVLYSYDRCVYPPSPSPYYPIDPIILWEGYNYNIVLLRDNHGNYIENAQVAIYDQTNSTYIQKWTPNPDGYLLLGALFNDSDHNTRVMVRTFDGVFTLETTYPANGSSPVGSEDITQTNMTIPIHYNIQMDTQDQFGIPLTGVFCGLAEYAPHNPLSFWGYSMGGRQYVPVTNCSGFAMCDIYAEKGGYGDYDVTALNWTSRSAMVKDYRHEIVMVKE